MKLKRFAKEIGYPAFVLSVLVLDLILLYAEASRSDWHDFDVFYGAASAALHGNSSYIIVGQYHLPFWYPPWSAWFFIPFAIVPRHVGLLLYEATLVVSAVLVVHFLTHYFNPRFRRLDELLILALLVPMSLQLVLVGQMEYILLGLIVWVMWAASRKNDFVVAVLFPWLLVKPHLIIPFAAFLFWRLGRHALVFSAVSCALLGVLATILRPHWYLEMLALLQGSGGRTAGLPFTTLPSLLGGQENWLGTANVPFTLLLILAALLVLWRVRKLPMIPLLSLASALSLFCAPRAYAYDLPLLIPAIVWLTAEMFSRKVWIWIGAAIIPMVLGFSSATYLVTLGVCLLAARKAMVETSTDWNNAVGAPAAAA